MSVLALCIGFGSFLYLCVAGDWDGRRGGALSGLFGYILYRYFGAMTERRMDGKIGVMDGMVIYNYTLNYFTNKQLLFLGLICDKCAVTCVRGGERGGMVRKW